MRKAPRKPEQLDALELFRILDRPDGTSHIADQDRVQAFLDQVRNGLTAALGRASTVHGWRAQAHFAGLVVALDGCELLLTLDSGEVFMDGDDVKLPDYLLVTKAGDRLLVEVKTVPPHKGLGDVELSDGEMSALRRFARLEGGNLQIAVFFSALGQWALVPHDLFAFDATRQKHRIGGAHAFKASTLSQHLGDVMIGVEPPIVVSVVTDPQEPIEQNQDGTYRFTIGSVTVTVGGRALLKGAAKRLATQLYLHGQWSDEVEADIGADGKLRTVNFVAAPDEPTPGQGFEIISTLSGLYQRYMDGATRSGATVYGLQVPTPPGMLTTLLPADFRDPDLPLWRFHVSPS